MKILLGNTGRGGEICLFTSIIRSYRNAFPAAEIEVAVGPYYQPMFDNSADIDQLHILPFKDESSKFYNNPVESWKYLAKLSDADIVEFPCEFNYSPAHIPGAKTKTSGNTSLYNCYLRIKDKVFDFVDVPRKVYFYPTSKEILEAGEIAKRYDSLIMISHVAKSADPMLTVEQYNDLGRGLRKFGTVCYTGSVRDPELPDLVDLRGISYGTLFALSMHLTAFIGPDTATPFIVSRMSGKLVVLRGDKLYPLSNTGLIGMGYRDPVNTWEFDCHSIEFRKISHAICSYLDE